LPHLKALNCFEVFGKFDNANLEILAAILPKSQLEEFETRCDHNDKDLLKLLAK
jgi:hypothetical protein